MKISSHIEMIYLKKCLARHILKKIGISDFIFSPPLPTFFILLRSYWYVMIYNKKTSKKAFADIPRT